MQRASQLSGFGVRARAAWFPQGIGLILVGFRQPLALRALFHLVQRFLQNTLVRGEISIARFGILSLYAQPQSPFFTISTGNGYIERFAHQGPRMTALSDFPITKKWPAQHPERIQLYSLPTPNGVKVSIMLEETGLAYEPHLVRFDNDDQLSPEFLSLNPNNKIPAMIDPDGPNGEPLALFESGAILIYLAAKSGRFMPEDIALRYEALQWLMFQMGGIGPMFGQVGFFHKFAGKAYEDKRPRDRYVAEAKRLLGVLDKRLATRDWIMGDEYGVADIATFPWVRNLVGFYEARELVGFDEYKHVQRALDAFVARPAVQRGLEIPKRV
jgi:GSH-dependent disulfide-bond oxidoreductase